MALSDSTQSNVFWEVKVARAKLDTATTDYFFVFFLQFNFGCCAINKENVNFRYLSFYCRRCFSLLSCPGYQLPVQSPSFDSGRHQNLLCRDVYRDHNIPVKKTTTKRRFSAAKLKSPNFTDKKSMFSSKVCVSSRWLAARVELRYRTGPTTFLFYSSSCK